MIQNVSLNVIPRQVGGNDIARPSVVPTTTEGLADDAAEFTGDQDFHSHSTRSVVFGRLSLMMWSSCSLEAPPFSAATCADSPFNGPFGILRFFRARYSAFCWRQNSRLESVENRYRSWLITSQPPGITRMRLPSSTPLVSSKSGLSNTSRAIRH